MPHGSSSSSKPDRSEEIFNRRCCQWTNAAAAILPELQRWNMRFLLKIAFSSLALGCLIAWSVKGGDGSGCCRHCGCNNLVPTCKQLPVVTKVPKVEWSCKCGDICVPGRSIYCG